MLCYLSGALNVTYVRFLVDFPDGLNEAHVEVVVHEGHLLVAVHLAVVVLDQLFNKGGIFLQNVVAHVRNVV